MSLRFMPNLITNTYSFTYFTDTKSKYSFMEYLTPVIALPLLLKLFPTKRLQNSRQCVKVFEACNIKYWKMNHQFHKIVCTEVLIVSPVNNPACIVDDLFLLLRCKHQQNAAITIDIEVPMTIIT